MEEIDKNKGLQIFSNSEFGKITAIEIDGEPWFVAREICRALDLLNTTEAVRGLDEDELRSEFLMSGGQMREMKVVSESGLYAMVIRSTKPQAKQFRKWITSEVLPAIRKTGGYQVQHKLPTTFAEALRALADETEAKEKALLEIERHKPKVEFFDQVTDSSDAVDMAVAAQVLNMGIGRNTLFKFLREEKILKKNNLPYEEFVGRGYFRVIEQKYNTTSGELRISFKTVVYQRGLDFIRRRYLGRGK